MTNDITKMTDLELADITAKAYAQLLQDQSNLQVILGEINNRLKTKEVKKP